MTTINNIFANEATKYWQKGLNVIPVVPGTKRGIKNWNNYKNDLPNPKMRQQWTENCANHGIGLLTGLLLEDGTRIAAIDVDNDLYVDAIKRMVGVFPCAKKGKKGITVFVRVAKEVKSMAIPKTGDRIVDVLVTNKLCVLPPTIHPDTKQSYEWIGKPLPETELAELPFMSETEIKAMATIFGNENHPAVMAGEATHDAALSVVGSLASKLTDEDEDVACRYVEALLPENYNGNVKEELHEMYRSAKEKGFGKKQAKDYDPGEVGPVPMGYTDHSHYVFMHQQKKIVVVCSPRGLMSAPGLYDLAPSTFWIKTFPLIKEDGPPGINISWACDTLIQASVKKGPFMPDTVRGSGIWREGDKIIPNLRGVHPESDKYVYTRFRQLPEFNAEETVDPKRVLDWLQLFKWEKPGYATLALGWTASSVICGALEWRTHIFINGPKNSGKSTLIQGLESLLQPMVLVLDGGSTEAGIRQSTGPDSRPVILDEFESDQDVGRMQRVIKMIRSASSARGAIARGTPEGKALQFLLHSTFCLGAINPIRGTSADASRIVNIGLMKHDNDRSVNDKIKEGLRYLHQKRTAWPHQMIELAETMLSNIDIFEGAMPPGDSRHNKNMANLLASAFTALNARASTKEEAEVMISEHSDIIQELAKAHEDDNATGCLNHLLCYTGRVGGFSIGELITDMRSGNNLAADGSAYPTLPQMGIKLGPNGFLVANQHPALEKIYADTIWAAGAWGPALKRIEGAVSDDSTRTRFSGSSPVRCTLLPYAALGEVEFTQPVMIKAESANVP